MAGKPVKERDIEDIEIRTRNLTGQLTKLNETLVKGKGGRPGLIDAAEQFQTRPEDSVCRHRFLEILAETYKETESLRTETSGIISDFSELIAAGRDRIMIGEESRLISDIHRDLSTLCTLLNSTTSMLREIAALQLEIAEGMKGFVIQLALHYMKMMEIVKGMYPEEEQLDLIYHSVRELVDRRTGKEKNLIEIEKRTDTVFTKTISLKNKFFGGKGRPEEIERDLSFLGENIKEIVKEISQMASKGSSLIRIRNEINIIREIVQKFQQIYSELEAISLCLSNPETEEYREMVQREIATHYTNIIKLLKEIFPMEKGLEDIYKWDLEIV